jgi:hypothetical protein
MFIMRRPVNVDREGGSQLYAHAGQAWETLCREGGSGIAFQGRTLGG